VDNAVTLGGGMVAHIGDTRLLADGSRILDSDACMVGNTWYRIEDCVLVETANGGMRWKLRGEANVT